MKKLSVRLVAYFSIGLVLFLAYLIFMSSFLIYLFVPSNMQALVYFVDDTAAPIGYILILLFCFISGGALFSVFFVYPLIYIMNAVKSLSQDNFGEYETTAFKKNGKIKLRYFLYKEIIINIVTVGKALERARIEREQLDKAKNEWIAGVSHDLKTPLAYVTGYASLIMNNEYQWDVQEIVPYVEEIYSKAMRVENIIEDLNMTFFLDHLDASQLKLKQVDLIRFLQNIMTDIANEPNSHGFELVFESELEHLDVLIDDKLMYRAIYNLLMNALKHNPQGTEITVRVSKHEAVIFLDISDDGVGIDNDALPHVFERYYSDKENPHLHKGLGLSIVKQIIEAHNADITVESSLGKGTTFQIAMQ